MSQNFCIYCGNELHPEWLICPQCGTPINPLGDKEQKSSEVNTHLQGKIHKLPSD